MFYIIQENERNENNYLKNYETFKSEFNAAHLEQQESIPIWQFLRPIHRWNWKGTMFIKAPHTKTQHSYSTLLEGISGEHVFEI